MHYFQERPRDFFGGGNTFSKKFSKNSHKIFKKLSKNIPKNSKNIQKFSKKFSKIFKKGSKKFWKILKNFLKKFPKMYYFQERPRDFFGGEVRSTRGGLVRGVAAWGVPGGRSPPDAGEVFKKFVKNQ